MLHNMSLLTGFTHMHVILYIYWYLYFLIIKENAYSMSDQPRKKKISFVRRRNDSITPDIIMKSFWVSTSLALILTIPPLAIFITVFQTSGNLLMGVVTGFGIHFILFSQSVRISSFITSFFDDWKSHFWLVFRPINQSINQSIICQFFFYLFVLLLKIKIVDPPKKELKYMRGVLYG